MIATARLLAGAAVTALAVTGCSSPAPSSVAGATSSATVQWTDTPTAEPTPDGSLDGDGTYTVGTDIQPGTYRSPGAGDSTGMCYWARLHDTTGDMEAILANNAGKGPQVVTVKPSDAAFTTRGCSDWTRA